MKTIYEVMKTAKVGDLLTDGVRTWKVVDDVGEVFGIPLKYNKKSFELWSACEFEKVAVIPGLRVIRSKSRSKK